CRALASTRQKTHGSGQPVFERICDRLVLIQRRLSAWSRTEDIWRSMYPRNTSKSSDVAGRQKSHARSSSAVFFGSEMKDIDLDTAISQRNHLTSPDVRNLTPEALR